MNDKNIQMKWITLAIFFLLIGVSILPSISSQHITISKDVSGGKTFITVDDDGDGDFTSIQDAIDNATSGDTIEVYSGTYLETDIVVNKQLILQGIDTELGNGSGSGKPLIINNEDDKKVVMLNADGCRISGFHIKSTGCCSWGIYLFRSNNHHVYQNEIDNINFGIYLRVSSNNNIHNNIVTKSFYAIINSYISHNNQIYDNYVFDCGYGIRIDNYAENITVYNNTVSEINAVGIGTAWSNNNTIHGNKVTNCGKGIELWMEDDDYGYRNTVYNNLITSCGRGIYVTGKDHKIYRNNIINCKFGIRMETLESIPPVYCCNNSVFDNTIINSRDTGIRLDGVYTTDIYKNIITNSDIMGLYLFKAKMNNIFENNITYNDNGIWLTGSEGNVIYHNNFIGNSENAYCYGDPWDRHNSWNLGYSNDGGGNYWDDYKGNDRNGDGIGDRPYIIPDTDYNRLNNDRDEYPLMEPDGRPNSRVHPVSRLHLLRFSFLQRFPLLERLMNLILT